MDIKKQFKIFLKGEDKTKSVKSYRHIGNKCEVTFLNGKIFTYNTSNVRIVESALNEQNASECFTYLRELADEVGITVEVENGKFFNILSHNYSKIGFVEPDSLLAAFLSGKFSEDIKTEKMAGHEAIYPFGFNSSQKMAVDNALANRLSIIEGPPGTGKTQTILNIIANVVMRGESVAVVSSNNSATKNVFDKLAGNGLGFIAASLGSKSNRIDFIDSQLPLPAMNDWILSSEVVKELRETLRVEQQILQEKINQKAELLSFKQELARVEIEIKYFDKYTKGYELNEDLKIIGNIRTSSDALDVWLHSENDEEDSWIISFLKYIFEFFKKGKSKRMFVYDKLREYSRERLIGVFQREFYMLKVQELNHSISKLSNELKLYNYAAKISEHTDISLLLFKARLAEYYRNKGREKYKVEDLRKDSESFLQDYPVILSTTYSLRNSLSNEVMYDYLIVDESSQVDLCTGAQALSCAKKIVVVGDLKQLPHVVDSKAARETDSIFEKYKLSENYRYKSQNLLSSMISTFPDAPRTLLREHYRCNPKIIEFCNKKFYDDQLIIMTEANSERGPLVLYKTVAGNHERNRMNQRQIDVIKEEIISEQSLDMSDGSLGIITPYRNQTNQLQKAFAGTGVHADTVDKFQGQEKNVVILSTVDNDISKFADNENRLNVAISRAIDQLIVVVNGSSILDDTNIGDLVRYIEYNNLSIIDSKVHSVFDYLYSCYAKHRQIYLSKNKLISVYDSENLMYALIMDVLKDSRFKSFSISAHVPLKMIIRDVELLTSEEAQYVSNILSHVDFLVYDTFNKLPKLAIEVDGVAFHAEGTKQALRDKMKNEIFLKFELPLLRLRTDGSNERKKLIEGLESIIG